MTDFDSVEKIGVDQKGKFLKENVEVWKCLEMFLVAGLRFNDKTERRDIQEILEEYDVAYSQNNPE